MKTSTFKIFICFFLLFLFLPQINADVTKTKESVENDPILKSAFDAINAGTIKNRVITLQKISSTTETTTAKLNASGSGNASYASAVIYPTVCGYLISVGFNTSPESLKINVICCQWINNAGDGFTGRDLYGKGKRPLRKSKLKNF